MDSHSPCIAWLNPNSEAYFCLYLHIQLTWATTTPDNGVCLWMCECHKGMWAMKQAMLLNAHGKRIFPPCTCQYCSEVVCCREKKSKQNTDIAKHNQHTTHFPCPLALSKNQVELLAKTEVILTCSNKLCSDVLTKHNSS